MTKTKQKPTMTGYIYGDIIILGQYYIQTKGQDQEARAELIAVAERVTEQAIDRTIKGIKRAIQEGMEDAFLYDPAQELKKVHRTKEVSQEEYEDSPIRQAYNEYVNGVKSRFGDLSMPCSVKALTAGEKIPSYKRGLKQVLAQAEAYIKQIQEETELRPDIATILTSHLVSRILVEWYDLYHQKEAQALRDYMNQVEFKTTTDQLTERFLEYYSNIYKYDQRNQITAEIIGRLFPKVRHIQVSDTLSIELGEVVQLTKPDIYSLVDYHTIRQGKATNTLARIKTRLADPAHELDFYGNAVIKDRGFELFITKYRELTNGVRPTANLLLDALVITATERGKRDTLVKLPLKEYMEMRGISDVKTARKQVNEDLEALLNIRISFTDKRRNPKTGKYETENYLDMWLCQDKGIFNGVIEFNFGEKFYSLLQSYPVMPYPKEILTFNLKHNPHSPRLLRRITEHKNTNYYHSNGDIISVKTLMEACPELPKYSELGEAIQARKRIIDPFERDMDAIGSFRWHYCGPKGIEIEPPLTYAEFQEALIKITWLDYPERQRKEKGKKALTN